jgi:hypothetical protein
MPAQPPPDDALFRHLEQALKDEKSDRNTLYQLVANAPFSHDRDMGLLFLGFISFFVVDDDRIVRLVGVTDNDYYRDSVRGYNFKTYDYRVPLSAKGNTIVKAIKTGKPIKSSDWDTFRRPGIGKGPARLNQANSGIGHTVVYPLKGKTKGALMFNFFQYPELVGQAQDEFMRRYTAIVSDTVSGFKDAVAA